MCYVLKSVYQSILLILDFAVNVEKSEYLLTDICISERGPSIWRLFEATTLVGPGLAGLTGIDACLDDGLFPYVTLAATEIHLRDKKNQISKKSNNIKLIITNIL